ncbi:MAG: hypothetical protein AAF628_15540 [Planctomycetota bacterium]
MVVCWDEAHWRRRAVVLAWAGASLVGVAMAQDDKPPVPVRKVVLYKHGIGFFERRGMVDGNAVVSLSFATAQMKDVLKSLFAVDLGGGRVATAVYDSQDPIAKQLEDIPYRVPDEPALKGLLAQLQGVRVAVKVGMREARGRVLGTEPEQRRVGDEVVTSHRLVLLRDDGGGIEAVPLLDAEAVEVLDAEVRRDLGRMMEVLGKARHADRKTLQLHAAGTGRRELRVGYILETPVWKTSYRLLLDDDAAPVLQGWAIVENRTDEDWHDVELSFVAGSPLSFVMDLYTSHYPERPVLQLGPLSDDSASESLFDSEHWNTAVGLGGGAGGKFGGRGGGRSRTRDAAIASFVPAARGAALGELFSYAATAPVTIQRQRAALVPILQSELRDCPRVLYARPRAKHPSHALYLHNRTGLTLERGPVTVFGGSACLGESLLRRTLGEEQRALLPYALEPAVEIEVRSAMTKEPVTRASLTRGLLVLTQEQVRETRYVLRNRGTRAATLYLDHQRIGGRLGEGFALRPSVKPPHDELPGVARFELSMPAADGAVPAVVELVVQEARPQSTKVQLSSLMSTELRAHAAQRYASQALRGFLAEMAEVMDAWAAAEARLKDLDAERDRLAAAEAIARENLRVLRDGPAERVLRDRSIARLTHAIERNEAIEAEIAAAQAQRDELESRFAARARAFAEPR